jgi:broad specificity phosphatase PhoE
MREHLTAIKGKSMAAQIERRLGALEARDGGNDRPALLVVRYIVAPGHLDAEPLGIEAAPPYLNAVDRLPGESWTDFAKRLRGMIAHLPAGSAVRVTTRDA